MPVPQAMSRTLSLGVGRIRSNNCSANGRNSGSTRNRSYISAKVRLLGRATANTPFRYLGRVIVEHNGATMSAHGVPANVTYGLPLFRSARKLPRQADSSIGDFSAGDKGAAWWRRLPHKFAELSRVGDDVLELHHENLDSGRTVRLNVAAAAIMAFRLSPGARARGAPDAFF
jgi:hypothetical protein